MKKLLFIGIASVFLLSVKLNAEFFCHCKDGSKISENSPYYSCNGNCSGSCWNHGGSVNPLDRGPYRCRG